jgi:hypothetical protein
MKMNETWKPVLGYEGAYEVSDLGNVRSVSRSYEEQTEYKDTGRKRIRRHRGRLLKFHADKAGYKRCYLSKDSKAKAFLVHRVIWEAFTGEPIPKTYQIDHIDSNKQNNRFDNLRCVSRREHGKISADKGELKCYNRKLTKKDVLEIKQMLLDEAVSYQSIADKYGVHRSTIQAIYTGKSWSHVGLKDKSEYERGYQAALDDLNKLSPPGE